MLGYSSNAEMVLEDTMAKNIDNVEKLLDDLTHRVTPKARKELQDLVDFKRSFKGHEEDDFEKWDLSEYAKLYGEAMTGVSSNDIA